MKKNELITAAMFEALKSNMYHKHGAIIIHRNKIIGRGHNYAIGERRMKNGRWSVHAEINAIYDCKDHSVISEATLYVVRISPMFINDVHSGNFCFKPHIHTKESKPCSKCQKALNKLKITRIWHT